MDSSKNRARLEMEWVSGWNYKSNLAKLKKLRADSGEEVDEPGSNYRGSRKKTGNRCLDSLRVNLRLSEKS